MHMISLKTALQQLQQKKVISEELDVRIANFVEEITVLEEEICDVKESKTVLSEKIQDFIRLANMTSSVSPMSLPPISATQNETPPETTPLQQ